MPIANFDQIVKQLISEFENSGLNIDEFITRKLADNGRSDAAEVVNNISATLNSIDQKFESLQKFKEDGGNREEWLRQELDEATQDFSSEQSGQVLSSSIKVLEGNSSDEPDEDANYDALDAVVMIRNIDDAIVKNTCNGLNSKEGK